MIGRPLIVDTNVLIMYAVGLAEIDFATHQCTKSYTSTDFEEAKRYINRARRLISLPNIWTEFSNLTIGRRDRQSEAITAVFLGLLNRWSEEYAPTTEVIASESGLGFIAEFGLTDNAIASVAVRSGADVLTDDGRLSDWLGRNRITAYNIRHARTPR